MKLNFPFKLQNQATDPICLMKVDKDENALDYKYRGEIYYFCSNDCLEQFKREPEKYLL